ncbi:MAG: thiamine-phosphate kinase [Opitutales bacterium]|jgi:thiamine-monophosphate kinase
MHPFTPSPAESVAALGESALLRAIRGWLGAAAPPSPWGMGDDCAVLETAGAIQVLATTDGVVYGRHFDDTAAPTAVGAKLLKRNVSDIAAMGGQPASALINLLLARNVSTAWLEQFYTGLAQSARQYRVRVVGGDIAQAPDGFFAAHLTLLGLPGKTLLLRTNAQLGDFLFVTGELGGSIFGKHLEFTPRLAEGQWLATQPGIRGVIDVTDGLAKDLPTILPAGADARLDVAALPISNAARELAARDGHSALLHALTDGEDYELLFALDPAVGADAFAARWREQFSTPLTCIGVIVPALPSEALPPGGQLRDGSGTLLLPPGAHGYEHLR